MNRTSTVFLFTAAAALVGLSAPAQTAKSSDGQTAAQPRTHITLSEIKAQEYPIPSNQGPSWIKHLGLTVSHTHMGQMGGSAPFSGKPTSLKLVIQRFLSTFHSSPDKAEEILNEKFTVSGADLYRWNCQSCHGPDGKGDAPEINSVIGPVQGTSPELTRKRMEARGIDTDDDMIKEVTGLAESSLRDRFQHGGKSMPAFEYLRADEVEALLGYLEKLADVPGSKRTDLLVPESAARVGEHIVRGTCHICHDATGPGEGHLASIQGTIPSLGSISQNDSLSGIVHQVQYGSCSMMRITGNDVMPAYPYFADDEIAAVYLLAYSPR